MSLVALDESSLLQGHQPAIVVATEEGVQTSLSSRSHKYFIVDGRLLPENISTGFIESVKRHRHDVYGILLSGSKLQEESLAMITEQLLPQLPYLEFYDASYLPISVHTQIKLCRLLNPLVLGYCPILRLHLVRCGLGAKGGNLIFNALQPNVTLQELHVAGNSFGDEVVPSIVNFLSNSDNTLKVFSVGNNSISSAGMKKLSFSIGNHPQLAEFYCDGNPIQTEGMDALMKQVWKGKLVNISLSNCNIAGCNWASALIYMTSLETLSLSCNRIDGAGLQNLCEGIEKCCCLRHLDISHNPLDGPQASSIGLLMKKHKGIVSINMAGTALSKEVINNIQLGILGNITLRVLDLSWCCLCVEDSKCLIEALAHNSLLELILSNNPIPPVMQNTPRNCSTYRNKRKPLEKAWTKRENPIHVNEAIASILATSNIETGMEDVSKLEFAFMDPLHAEAASAIWRKERLSKVLDSKKAFDIVQQAGVLTAKKSAADSGEEELENKRHNDQDEKDEALKIHIDPGYAAEKAQKEQDKATSAMILSNTENERRLLSVSYGRKTEFLGTIEVTEDMTYFDTRPLVRPLFEEYFNTNDDEFLDSVMPFKILDADGRVIPPDAEKVRIAWTELSMCGLYLNLLPASWVYIPPADDDDQ